MCITIEINGETCETLGELRKHVAKIAIDTHYNGRSHSDDACLCCIDVEATAEANGYKAIGQRGFTEFLFKENNRCS